MTTASPAFMCGSKILLVGATLRLQQQQLLCDLLEHSNPIQLTEVAVEDSEKRRLLGLGRLRSLVDTALFWTAIRLTFFCRKRTLSDFLLRLRFSSSCRSPFDWVTTVAAVIERRSASPVPVCSGPLVKKGGDETAGELLEFAAPPLGGGITWQLRRGMEFGSDLLPSPESH